MLCRLFWVYSCQNATLFEAAGCGSYRVCHSFVYLTCGAVVYSAVCNYGISWLTHLLFATIIDYPIAPRERGIKTWTKTHTNPKWRNIIKVMQTAPFSEWDGCKLWKRQRTTTTEQPPSNWHQPKLLGSGGGGGTYMHLLAPNLRPRFYCNFKCPKHSKNLSNIWFSFQMSNQWGKSTYTIKTKRAEVLPVLDVLMYSVGTENQQFSLEVGEVCFG